MSMFQLLVVGCGGESLQAMSFGDVLGFPFVPSEKAEEP